MKATRFIATGMSLLLVLSGNLRLPSVHAGRNFADSTLSRVYFGSTLAPIGTFKSSRAIIINGRPVENHGALWDGELLHTPEGSTTQAELDGIGQVTLGGGTMVKLTANAVTAEPGDQRRLLTASIVSGELTVKLHPAASALLMAGGATFGAPAGASFRIAMNHGRPVVTSEDETSVRSLGNWGIRPPALTDKVSVETTSNPAKPEASLITWPAITLPDAIVTSVSRKKSTALAESATNIALTRADTGPKVSSALTDEKRTAFLRSLNLTPGISAVKDATSLSPAARLSANPLEGMIGTVEAPSAMKINGRPVRGKEVLWDGELLEAPAEMLARVTLNGIGSVALAAATRARISTATVRLNDQSLRRVLVASIVSGDCVVRLQPESGAFVQAFGQAFAASGGAHFRLGAREGRAVVDVTSGIVESIGRYVVELMPPSLTMLHDLAVTKEQTTPRKYRIAAAGSGYQTVVPLNGSRELKFKVTDDHGRIAAGIKVRFELKALDQAVGIVPGSFGFALINSATWNATTNTVGEVTVPYSAGANPGSVSVVASVGDDQPQSAAIISSSGHSGFWTTKTAVPVLLTTAAMIGIGTTIAVTRGDKLPIKGSGQTSIVP